MNKANEEVRVEFSQIENYLVPALFFVFVAWRFFKFRQVRTQLTHLLLLGAVVVDVRSPGEFAGGSSPGSINIPLNEIGLASQKLDKTKPVVVCCASGTRSAIAAARLRSDGFVKVVNAGGWQNTLIQK